MLFVCIMGDWEGNGCKKKVKEWGFLEVGFYELETAKGAVGGGDEWFLVLLIWHETGFGADVVVELFVEGGE